MKRALALGAGALLAVTALAATNAAADDTRLDHAAFESLLHQSFYVNSEHGVVILDLVEVEDRKRQTEDPPPKEGRKTEQFSITFLGPPRPVLPSAVYRVEHRLAGNTDIYLEPIGADGLGMRYRARFALLR